MSRQAPSALYRSVRDVTLERVELDARGVLASPDPEYLHQLRVGLRRLRAALRAFRRVLPRKKRRRLVRRLRALSPVLGRARDWDVILASGQVEERLLKRARKARAAALAAVASPRFARLVQHARALDPHQSDEAMRGFAAKALDRARRRVAPPADWSDAKARHRLRICVKRLRYGCEFFAPAFPNSPAAAYIADLKGLQTILGELNDMAVARSLAGLRGDEAPLLRRLGPAWARFEKRPAFWRAAARTPPRAAR